MHDDETEKPGDDTDQLFDELHSEAIPGDEHDQEQARHRAQKADRDFAEGDPVGESETLDLPAAHLEHLLGDVHAHDFQTLPCHPVRMLPAPTGDIQYPITWR